MKCFGEVGDALEWCGDMFLERYWVVSVRFRCILRLLSVPAAVLGKGGTLGQGARAPWSGRHGGQRAPRISITARWVYWYIEVKPVYNQ